MASERLAAPEMSLLAAATCSLVVCIISCTAVSACAQPQHMAVTAAPMCRTPGQSSQLRRFYHGGLLPLPLAAPHSLRR